MHNMTYKTRIISFKALVGSHNYNLATEESDKDYKVFLYPTFNDLYNMKELSGQLQSDSDKEDITYHDVRKLYKLFTKSNISQLEILFSSEVIKGDGLYDELYAMRDKIATINLKYLYDSTMGMVVGLKHNIAKQYNKGDTDKVRKLTANILRLESTLTNFWLEDFKDFGEAVRFDNESNDRKRILSIREGRESLKDSMTLQHQSELRLAELKPKYYEKSNDSQKEIEQEIYNILYRYVRNHIEKNQMEGKY